MDGSPPVSSVCGRILEWVAFLLSKGSSRPRDQTPVSCIAGRFFTSWATVETSVTHSVTWAIANFWGLASFEEVSVVCAYGVFVRIRRDRDSEDNL